MYFILYNAERLTLIFHFMIYNGLSLILRNDIFLGSVQYFKIKI